MTSGLDGRAIVARSVKLAIDAMRKHQLHPEVAMRYGLIQALLQMVGRDAPAITSGGRTAAYQKELYDCWLKPACRSRRGIVAKPARSSWHIGGLAFDANSYAKDFALFTTLWKVLPGGRYGGDFSTPDRVHFDIGGLKAYQLLGYPKQAW